MKKPTIPPYLTTLSKQVKKLLALLGKQKPGTAYTHAELLEFASFPQTAAPRSLKHLEKEVMLVPLLAQAKRKDAIYFLQTLLRKISEAFRK